MKTLKFLLITFFALTLVLGAIYFYFTQGKTSTLTSTSPEVNQERPIGTPKLRTNEETEYTYSSLKNSEDTISIRGFFQVAKPSQTFIDGATYDYVIGILGDDESIARIRLTSEEYEKL